jgi:ABC-2 type transport system permease protein
MKTFLTLLIREMKSYFYSPIAYVVLFYFLLLMGFNTWALIAATNGQPVEVTLVQQFFSGAIFWFPFILIFPLITMRVFSEEFRMGTIETLTTAPVGDLQIVTSKLLSTFLFSCLLLAPSLAFFAVYSRVSGHTTATATGAYWTSYGLLLLISLFYCSIGCLASALARDQVNAAMVSFTTITLLLFLGFIFDIANVSSPIAREVEGYISPVGHMQDFSKGVVDSRPIVFYLTMTALVTFLTFQVFQYRKWKS